MNSYDSKIKILSSENEKKNSRIENLEGYIMSIEQKIDTRRQQLTERVKMSQSKSNSFKNNTLTNSIKLSESTNFGHHLHGLSKSEIGSNSNNSHSN